MYKLYSFVDAVADGTFEELKCRDKEMTFLIKIKSLPPPNQETQKLELCGKVAFYFCTGEYYYSHLYDTKIYLECRDFRIYLYLKDGEIFHQPFANHGRCSILTLDDSKNSYNNILHNHTIEDIQFYMTAEYEDALSAAMHQMKNAAAAI